MEKSSGKFLFHKDCPSCGSSDALAAYEKEDGRIDYYCWSCNTYFGSDKSEREGKPEETKKNTSEGIGWIHDLPIKAFEARGISEEAAKKYGVRVAHDTTTGEISHRYYPITKDGKITGYKERDVKTKQFRSIGDTRHCEFFGQSLHEGGRKFLICVEGEEDALASYDILKKQGKDYAVVSIPHGAGSAKRSAQDNLEWLESFETIVLMLDQDKHGEKASKEIAELLTPGKAKIAKFSEKDANDMLLKKKFKEWMQAIYNAKEYRPDGIVRLSQSWDELWIDESIESIPYPWEGVNKKLYGVRPREIVTVTSGSGL